MPHFENDLQNRWHMYPQPLMHVRPSIFCLYVFAGESGQKKKTPGRKESHSKDMVIPSVPEASHVIYLA
jgi:hypothetical protein